MFVYQTVFCGITALTHLFLLNYLWQPCLSNAKNVWKELNNLTFILGPNKNVEVGKWNIWPFKKFIYFHIQWHYIHLFPSGHSYWPVFSVIGIWCFSGSDAFFNMLTGHIHGWSDPTALPLMLDLATLCRKTLKNLSCSKHTGLANGSSSQHFHLYDSLKHLHPIRLPIWFQIRYP